MQGKLFLSPLVFLLSMMLSICLALFANISNASSEDRMNAESSESADDPHAQHRMMMQNPDKYSRIYSRYNLPPVMLKNQHGDDVNLHDILHSDRPFIVSYIFTTCTTICPVLTSILSSAQKELMASDVPPLMVSISIDPTEDTPDKLLAYAKKFNANKDWVFLTGSLETITEIQRSMDVYRGGKLNHEPVTFVKSPKYSKWMRLNGFTSSRELVQEYNNYIQ